MANTTQDTKEEVDFDTLLQDVINDSSKVANLTEEQVIELRKKISPYGRTIDGAKNLCCMSLVNVSQEYMKKWLMTGLIGFLFRGVDEYGAFENEPVVHLDDMDESQRKNMLETLYRDAIPARQELAKLMEEDRKQKEAEMKEYYEKNKEQIALDEAEQKVYETGSSEEKKEFVPWQEKAIDKNAAGLREQQMRTLERIIVRAENMTKRFVIREFLDTLFTFNPDVHVRGAYGFNPLDPERKEVKTAVAKKSNKSWKKRDRLDKKKKKSDDKPVEYKDEEDEFDGTESQTRKDVTRHIPPADTYFKFQMYLDDHHDQLKAAVVDLYHEKADIEWAVNPYEIFTDPEEAKKFVHKHADEVLWDIETLHTNHWNLMGSFKKNRDRTDFLNNNTEVITEYLDQLERDKKMGRQLMMKKAQRKKLESVGKEGPDSKMFRRYKKDFANTAEAMGAVDLSDYAKQKQAYEEYQKKQEEERLRLANAKRAPNGAIIADTTDLAIRSGIDRNAERKFEYPDAGLSAACPDDAVQVDVINMTQGGLNVQKSNFFTEAEAPAGVTEKKLGGGGD